jgi:hypothetical protein
MGNKAKGTSDVAGIGIASVTHQITVSNVIAAAVAGFSAKPSHSS